MVIVGAVLLVLCLLLGAGIALSNTDPVSAEAFGVSLSNVTLGGLFLVGVVVGALAMLGLALVLVGAARKRSRRKALKDQVRSVSGERESLAEENARLAAELERERTTTVTPYGDERTSTAEDTSRGRHGA